MQGILNSGMQAEAGARPAKPTMRGENGPQRRMDRPERGENPQQAQEPGAQSSNPVDMDPSVAGEQRNTLVNGMLGQLYGPQLERSANILNQTAEEPVEGIGRIVSGLMGATYKTITDEGREIPPGVMFQAGMMASQAVGEMAMRMGIIDEANEAETVESGFMMGIGSFGRANAGSMSPEERERYGQLIDGMEEGKRMAMGGAGEPSQNPGMMARGGA